MDTFPAVRLACTTGLRSTDDMLAAFRYFGGGVMRPADKCVTWNETRALPFPGEDVGVPWGCFTSAGGGLELVGAALADGALCDGAREGPPGAVGDWGVGDVSGGGGGAVNPLGCWGMWW